MKKFTTLVMFLENEGYDSTEVKLSTYDDNIFETLEGEYMVLTEKEADEAFFEYQFNLIEECGISLFPNWAKDYILKNFVDKQFFDDMMEESYRYYYEEIEYEDAYYEGFTNRLEEELSENGFADVEEYVSYLCNREDSIDWVITNFGEVYFDKIVEENGLLNRKETVEWIKEMDGRGRSLATYDGEEHEVINNDGEVLYIYKIN